MPRVTRSITKATEPSDSSRDWSMVTPSTSDATTTNTTEDASIEEPNRITPARTASTVRENPKTTTHPNGGRTTPTLLPPPPPPPPSGRIATHPNGGRTTPTLRPSTPPPPPSGRITTVRSVRSSKRKEAEAKLRLAQQRLEEAKAQTEICRIQAELAEMDSDEEEMDEELEIHRTTQVERWVEEQKQLQAPEPDPVYEDLRVEKTKKKERSDIQLLTEAILRTSTRQQVTNMYELPTFSGNIEDWLAFKNQYEETASNLTAIQNKARLRRSITGAAREAVRSLLMVAAEPEEIMNALERRYGRPDVIVLSEMEKMKRHPMLTDAPRDICQFASRVGNIVATIRALAKPYYLHSPELCRIIIEKLTPIEKYRWYDFRAKNQDQEEPELLKIGRFLNQEADLCGAYAPIDPTPRNHFKMNTRQAHHVHIEEVEEEEVVATTNVVQKKYCVFCTKEHWAQDCKKYLEAEYEKKWKMVMDNKLCFRCLRKNHQTATCRAQPCKICKKNHHFTLHKKREATKPEEKKTEEAVVTTATTAAATSMTAYLKIIPVEVYGPKGSEKILALMDEGSTVTMLDEAVAQKIGVNGDPEQLNIRTISGGRITTLNSCKADLKIKGIHRSDKRNIRNVRTIEDLQLPLQEVNKEDIESCEHLKKIESQIMFTAEAPRMIIGQDNWGLIVSRKIIKGKPSQPVASLTSLGWVLHGVNAGIAAQVNFVTYCKEEEVEDNIEKMMKEYFSIDSMGIQARRPKNDPEEKALKSLEETTRRLDSGRFETGLLWANKEETLPNNRTQALRRFKSIEKKLERDEDMKKQYEDQINNLLKKNYAEEAPPVNPENKRTFYLPHFGVIHPTKKKLRIVFDAAARNAGKCLNDALLSGPDQLQSLFGVLLRFREKPIAVMADIKEMFLQIKIREEDRDSLRFLWRSSNKEDVKEYRMTSVIFGATSSPAIAIYVKNKNAEEFAKQRPEAARAIVRNHYMDDYLQSFTTVEEAKKVSTNVDWIHKKAGFELRGWASNNQELKKHFATEHNEEVEITQQEEKTLGLLWNTTEDAIAFNVSLRNTPEEVIGGIRRPTKREVMSAVMSTFDPIGLLAPVLIQGKKMVQQLWRAGLSWDEEIKEEMSSCWQEYVQEIRRLKDLKIPRSLTKTTTAGELHIFVDASETVYAAAAYWRSEEEDGSIRVSLIAGKAKVAPTKPISMPRLELQAALLGSRLAKTIIEETDLKISKKTYWSDSSTVLQWIKTDSRKFKTFVAHRLAEIEENTKSQEWRWVPTKQNPADDATREVPRNFNAQSRWFTGPDFLRREREHWPEDKFERNLPKTGEEKEEKILSLTEERTNCVTPDEKKFSSWLRLLRSTARVLMFIDRCQKKKNIVLAMNKEDKTWKPSMKKEKVAKKIIVNSSHKKIKNNYLELEDNHLIKAEKMLIKKIQEDSFGEELQCLKKMKQLPKKSKLQPFEVFLDQDGIIRMKGRINKVNEVLEDMKTPAVLEGRHHIMKLLIKDYHENFHHGSHATVINEIRQKYYVIGLRSAVKKMTRDCQWCKIKKKKPQDVPTGDLPMERLQHHRRPFTYAAVDYFGPMKVTIGRRHEKRWGALFTCLTTRAVHIELAHSLSTSSMIMALRRMSARRGTPATIFSDNGTNFVGAERELREEIEKMNIEDIASKDRRIRWKFIAPGAPNMGGAWERLVRSVKTALYATMTEIAPSEETLHTLLTEIEHTINSRPLTSVDTEPGEEESLTPNHFLIGRSNGAPVIGNFADTSLMGKADWKLAQKLADHFWRRWIKEYLPELIPRRTKTQGSAAVNVGDVVLIADGTLPRNIWPRGQITKTLPGPDGRTRIVEVRTTGGTFRRPVSRIIVLVPAKLSPTDGASHAGEDEDDN